MKNLTYSLLLLIFFCSVSFPQDSTNDSTGTVTDIDGNVYKTVKIGNQWWMAENLKVTRYRNGDEIPYVPETDWGKLTTGACCSYDNANSNIAIYGLLYNWFAVADSHNIAPAGWHVPSYTEWQTLVDYLGGSSIAGGKMKEPGYAHWIYPNTGANNESGFSALPGGYRNEYGGYIFSMGRDAIFWEYSVQDAFSRSLWYNSSEMYRFNDPMRFGVSVRCVRDGVTMVENSALKNITNPIISQNYPNPFNQTTNIQYDLSKDSKVSLIIYNVHGQKIKELVNDFKPAGSYNITFDDNNLASGVYFYRIQAGDFVQTKCMLLIK